MSGDEKIKFIYWFAYYSEDSPSVRYRGKYPLEYLRKNRNADSYFITPGYSFLNIIAFTRAYLSALFFRRRNSLIVIQRIHSGFIYSSLLKLLVRFRKKNTFYDLDDADHLEYPPGNIFHFIKNCSGVFVGSHELKKNLSGMNSNVILNTSPTPDLGIVKKRKNETLHIGWIGDFAGDHKKAMITKFFPALKKLPFNVKLSLIGVGRQNSTDHSFIRNYFSDVKKVELNIPKSIEWKNETAIQEQIARFDIGIATLIDNEPHRSKSAFKLKQYLNNGVPVLSSDIPENNSFVQHGMNGFFCNSADEFTQRIIQFYETQEEEYMRFSIEAKDSREQFDIEGYCRTLLTGVERKRNARERRIEPKNSESHSIVHS